MSNGRYAFKRPGGGSRVRESQGIPHFCCPSSVLTVDEVTALLDSGRQDVKKVYRDIAGLHLH